MFNKELLNEVFDRFFENRAELYAQLQEMNAYTKEEDDKFIERTSKFEELKNELCNNDFVSKADYVRLAADFDNYKKRMVKAELNGYDRGSKDVILALLSVYDDLERTVKVLDKKLTPEQKMFEVYDVNPIHSGINISFENFEKILASFDCKKIDCKIGDKFDVNYHEAISSRQITENEKYSKDDICDIYQSGWMLNGKLLRPVKVVIVK